MKTRRIPVDQLVLKKNVPAGMNVLVVMSMVHMLRSSHADAAPAEVRKVGRKLYRIEDGRHRFFAAVMAGRRSLLCTVKKEDD